MTATKSGNYPGYDSAISIIPRFQGWLERENLTLKQDEGTHPCSGCRSDKNVTAMVTGTVKVSASIRYRLMWNKDHTEAQRDFFLK